MRARAWTSDAHNRDAFLKAVRRLGEGRRRLCLGLFEDVASDCSPFRPAIKIRDRAAPGRVR
jgi:hypothetical protein